MAHFNPQKYSSSSYSEDNNDEVEKGHKKITQVDIGKFDELCKKFKDKKDMKIKKLIGSDKEDFNLMVSYVHLLYGTSYYSHLFERVKKYFKNVNSILPGTVGSYFAGCLIQNENKAVPVQGCAISCAGSMPLPKDEEGWSFCDKAVILAEKENDSYNFSIVKPANTEEEMDPAYLFIESNSIDEFQGFSNSEKDQILAFGCKKVKLIGYNKNLNYSEIYDEPKPIRDIKHRNQKESSKQKEVDDDNSILVFLLLILFLFLLFVLCFLSYKMYKKE
jgi:hypothetical protein